MSYLEQVRDRIERRDYTAAAHFDVPELLDRIEISAEILRKAHEDLHSFPKPQEGEAVDAWVARARSHVADARIRVDAALAVLVDRPGPNS